MTVFDLAFPSASGDTRIHAALYTPTAVRTRALVLFAHDVTEHHRRHLSLITRLNDAGFAVAAADLVGHGLTAAANDSWGLSSSASGDGTVEDIRRLAARAMRLVPGVPLLLFGHGWGSVILRACMEAAGGQIAGAMFTGTLTPVPGLAEAHARAILEAQTTGADSPTSTLEIMFTAFSARVGGLSSTDWLTDSEALRADIASDPLCRPASQMSAGMVAGLIELALRVNSAEWAEGVPHQVPTMFLSGDRDAAGDFGAGVYAAANALLDTGSRAVRTRLLGGVRHDVLHLPEVADEAIAFFDEALALSSGRRVRRRG